MRIDTGDFEPGKGAEGADKVWRVDGKLAEAAHARVNFDMDFESTFRAAERARVLTRLLCGKEGDMQSETGGIRRFFGGDPPEDENRRFNPDIVADRKSVV